MTHLWFKARSYGWGWTPVSLEGWLVVIAFMVAVAISTATFLYHLRTGADVQHATVLFLLLIAFLSGALIAICWLTGGRPRPALSGARNMPIERTEEEFLKLGMQYYIAGKAAALAGLLPITGNLYHHAL